MKERLLRQLHPDVHKALKMAQRVSGQEPIIKRDDELPHNTRAGHRYWCWQEKLTGVDVRQAIRGLQQNTPVAAVVWDRAPAHREKGVRAIGIPLIELTPYSPELNPAERVFEEVRRVVEGTPYATLDAKVAAVNAVLERSGTRTPNEFVV